MTNWEKESFIRATYNEKKNNKKQTNKQTKTTRQNVSFTIACLHCLFTTYYRVLLEDITSISNIEKGRNHIHFTISTKEAGTVDLRVGMSQRDWITQIQLAVSARRSRSSFMNELKRKTSQVTHKYRKHGCKRLSFHKDAEYGDGKHSKTAPQSENPCNLCISYHRQSTFFCLGYSWRKLVDDRSMFFHYLREYPLYISICTYNLLACKWNYQN